MTHFVLDLGTNTFHLVIVRERSGTWTEVFRERQYVFLGEAGFDPIAQQAIKRATTTLQYFSECIRDFHCDDGVILATEGLRRASNSAALLGSWNQILPKPIQLISGNEEAQLIGQGVILAAAGEPISGWAVDIGGGSLEVVEIRNNQVSDLRSMPLGLSILHQWYKGTTGRERFELICAKLKNELEKELLSFHISESSLLIGVSGSFELIPTLRSYRTTILERVNASEVEVMVNILIEPPEDERHLIPWLPKERSIYILEAMAIIQVFAGLPFRDFLYCPYTLKEGALLKLRQG